MSKANASPKRYLTEGDLIVLARKIELIAAIGFGFFLYWFWR